MTKSVFNMPEGGREDLGFLYYTWHVFGWTFRGCASGCGTTTTTSSFFRGCASGWGTTTTTEMAVEHYTVYFTGRAK